MIRFGKPIIMVLCMVTLCSVMLCGCTTSYMGAASDKAEVVSEEVIADMKNIYLAGGCFWGVQKYFDQFDGVVFTEVGYANGPDEEPTYKEVCNSSGHAETVHIGYDDSKITLTKLLDYYFMVIDPLSVNKQGNDVGVQ